MCRRDRVAVTDRQGQRVMKDYGLLQKNPFPMTNNGSSFVARRFVDSVKDGFSHMRVQ